MRMPKDWFLWFHNIPICRLCSFLAISDLHNNFDITAPSISVFSPTLMHLGNWIRKRTLMQSVKWISYRDRNKVTINLCKSSFSFNLASYHLNIWFHYIRYETCIWLYSHCNVTCTASEEYRFTINILFT